MYDGDGYPNARHDPWQQMGSRKEVPTQPALPAANAQVKHFVQQFAAYHAAQVLADQVWVVVHSLGDGAEDDPMLH